MSWKLWLDDQMSDPATPKRHAPEGFVGAPSTKKAICLVKKLGPPCFVDLDHDLGENDTCKDFLRWLADNYWENIPEWAVHSANPLAYDWVSSFMVSWRKSLQDN